ncbi:MAG: hypothetical protein AAB870_05425 [Patescibacteria group bacterium]
MMKIDGLGWEIEDDTVSLVFSRKEIEEVQVLMNHFNINSEKGAVKAAISVLKDIVQGNLMTRDEIISGLAKLNVIS